MLSGQEKVGFLIKRVRKELKTSGHIVAVFASNTDLIERRFGNGAIRYYNRMPATKFPPSIFVVLSEIRFAHTDTDHIHKGNPEALVAVVQERELDEIFTSCKAELDARQRERKPTNGNGKPHPDAEKPPPLDEMSDFVLDYLTTPRSRTMSNMDLFVKDFLQAVEASSNGLVGKNTVGGFRKKYDIRETCGVLEKKKWIIGVVAAGSTKIGWYKPGELMGATAQQEKLEPEDGYELAKHLVAQKPEVLARQAEIQAKLARIEEAEQILAAIEKFKSSITANVVP